MKTQEHRIGDLRHSRFEADLEASIDVLFSRCPTLCGFSVRDAAKLGREDPVLPQASELFVTEVSIYPLTGLGPPRELCHEIVTTLLALIDGCPEASELLRERTFARVFH